jgi:hypothetical protein
MELGSSVILAYELYNLVILDHRVQTLVRSGLATAFDAVGFGVFHDFLL